MVRMVGGVVSVVKQMPCTHKALELIPTMKGGKDEKTQIR